MNDFGVIFHALSVAATVVFFLIPIVILFFKMVEDAIKPGECFWFSLPFALSLAGVLVLWGSPLRFLFWFTGIGYWVGLPIYFIVDERRSNARMREEDFEKCRQLIAFDPHNAAAYAQLGRLHARQRQWAEAVESYEQAVQLEPDNKRYRWELGKARSEQERTAEQTVPDGAREPPEQPEGATGPTEKSPAPEDPAALVQKAIQTVRWSERECPRCPGTRLHSAAWQEVPLEGCGRCGGFWFEKAHLARLLTASRGTLAELQALFVRQWSAVRQDRDHLICPHCQADLRRATLSQTPDLPLHGCPPCGGIWLEHGELVRLEERLRAVREETSEETGRG
jgi:Zn-finger nucleic acid-binding protein